MTYTHHDHSLSPLELVILARLSSKKSPVPKELAQAVLDLASPAGSPEQVQESIAQALAALRRRALVDADRLRLSEDGRRVLCAVFELEHVPTWTQIRALLPACSLGLRPGSTEAREALKTKSALMIAILRERGELPRGSTLAAVSDALIAEVLKLPPGRMTLKRIRAHALGLRIRSGSNTPDQVVAEILHDKCTDKKSMLRALGRRWLHRDHGVTDGRKPLPPITRPARPEQANGSDARRPTPPGRPVVDQKLLTLVREAIPRIGSDGRFGAEKVFVSALWRDIARDRRAPDLSLDRFKQWLVSANRDQLLNLARADLVGAMDARLVAESEIEDLGATFHFVLDNQARTTPSGRNNHAR